MEFREVYHRYKADLGRVEDVMHQAIQSSNAGLTTAATQLLDAGGKRIRPLFSIICSQVGSERKLDEVYRLAAAVELIHMATLVHDDVIDDAELRRGKPTVRSQYGDLSAMYTGDFLYAKAIELLSSLSSQAVHIEMSDAIVQMCRGEIEQIRDFYDWDQSLKNYLRRVKRKTALLISVSCSLGGTIAGASPRMASTLRRFGHYTGMAFQITDDVLDYVGDSAVVGKPVGGDLAQGNITLPALHSASVEPHGATLRKLIQPESNERNVHVAIDLITSTGSVEYAKDMANTYLHKAHRSLSIIQDSPIYEELTVMADFVNQRTY